MASALEMQYELMSHTVMVPLESPVINISLLGSVVRANIVLSSSLAAKYLPRKRNTRHVTTVMKLSAMSYTHSINGRQGKHYSHCAYNTVPVITN